ncbi:hypothetical protein ABT147_28895 [Streptomyces sp. NPDC001868]|uniref:hypothetical protein n=1 Tax=Streptomyces sp. NPDC001868 TaxID=3154401 RepID=UPI0033312C3F
MPDGQIADLRCLTARYRPGRRCRTAGNAGDRSAAGCSTGGIAPVRACIPKLLPDVLSGAIGPGPVFDRAVPLAEVPHGYRAMDDRSALKVRITF